MRSAGNRRGTVHLGHWLASDEVIPVESPEWFCRHARIETAHENFEGACSYYRRAFDLINAARLRIDEGKSRHGDIRSWGWWSSNSLDVARSLLGLICHVIQHYMGDKAEHLRAIAEDEGMTVDEVREALDAWKAAGGALTAVIADSPLMRLRARFEDRLREVELPAEGGFTSKGQADAVTRLSSTFYQLQNVEAGFGLSSREIPPKLTEGLRLRSEWQNHHDKEGRPIAVRPRGRPRRDAGDEGRIFLG